VLQQRAIIATPLLHGNRTNCAAAAAAVGWQRWILSGGGDLRRCIFFSNAGDVPGGRSM